MIDSSTPSRHEMALPDRADVRADNPRNRNTSGSLEQYSSQGLRIGPGAPGVTELMNLIRYPQDPELYLALSEPYKE